MIFKHLQLIPIETQIFNVLLNIFFDNQNRKKLNAHTSENCNTHTRPKNKIFENFQH